jgi:hypothetical protein
MLHIRPSLGLKATLPMNLEGGRAVPSPHAEWSWLLNTSPA